MSTLITTIMGCILGGIGIVCVIFGIVSILCWLEDKWFGIN